MHRTYRALLQDLPLASTITYVSDIFVLLTADRVLQAMEANIRIFNNCLTRPADIVKTTILTIKNFTNLGRYRLLLQRFVELVLITMLTTNRTVSEHSECSLICRKFAILGAEYHMLYMSAIILSKADNRVTCNHLRFAEIELACYQ